MAKEGEDATLSFDGDHWRTADPLNFAWFGHAPEELKAQYRDAGHNPSRTATLQLLMEAQVKAALSGGELVAFGIQTAPSADEAPRRIPATYFQAQSVLIDWENDVVTGLGRAFTDVRVSPAVSVPKSPAPKPGPNASPRGRGGRKSQYAQAREILTELYKTPGYAVMAAERLAEPFNRLYVERFSTPDRKATPISERSLRDHLKRYRQELAETGDN